MKPINTGYRGWADDNSDTRHLRRLRETPEYKQAEAEAQRFVERLAAFLSKDRESYHYGKTTRTLRDVGGADVTVTARPTLGPRGTANGQSFSVRIYGPRPESAVLYAASMKDSGDQALNVYRRLRVFVGRAKGGQARRKKPTILDAAAERTQAVAAAFGPRATYQSGQAKITMPGGAVIHVSGERDHDVTIEHLNEQQLWAVLQAIANTTEPQGR